MYVLVVIAGIACAVAWFALVPRQTNSRSLLGSGEMFNSIAPYYDNLNRIMSLGMDVGWRKQLVSMLELNKDDCILDVATGTGDVVFAIMNSEPSVCAWKIDTVSNKFGDMRRIQALDPSIKMLDEAKNKAKATQFSHCVDFVTGDVTDLSRYDPETFSKVTISFGIRNVFDRPLALAQIRRVMRIGKNNKLAIMEMIQPRKGLLAPLAQAFIQHIIPVLGTLFSRGHLSEYTHLRDSIAKFPTPGEFIDLLQTAGFDDCVDNNIMLDVVHVFVCNT